MHGILTDDEIRAARIVEPFAEGAKRPGVVSYGLSSMGYDMRIGYKFRVFTPALCAVVDPKAIDERAFVEVEKQRGDFILVPPNGYILAESLETFAMPDDVIGVCLGKSTYARCGIIVNVTPLEAGWVGKLTIELSNSCQLPVRVYCGEGIAQILFLRSERRPRVTYADKGGKYQSQAGLTFAKVDP